MAIGVVDAQANLRLSISNLAVMIVCKDFTRNLIKIQITPVQKLALPI